jgi:hypoxanthine phosphoribosyltransferase
MKKEKIVATNEQIKNAIANMARVINEDYKGLAVELITMNDASNYLVKDLLDCLKFDVKVQAIHFINYEEQTKSGEVRITRDIEQPIYGKHIILLDGIIISGLTHYYICNYLNQRSPKSLAISCVGVKSKQIIKKLPKCYSLFEFNEEWIEGYGIGTELLKSKPYLIDSKKDL